jgi:formylglycine-generating enzyme required for sulfatase activity
MLRRASDMIAAESAPASALKGRGDRRVRWPMLAAGLLLGAAGLVAAATIIIRIKNKWGGETTVEVADDSQISIERKQGDGTLPCPASGRGAGGEAASRRPPPLARPSMSAAEAKQVQQQWAQYLGVPVEQTNSVGMDLVLIPPGEFDMGSTPEEIARALEEGKKTTAPVYLDQVPGEGPRHRVKITRPFYLGMYPVTQAEYEKLTGINPSAFTAKQADVSIFKPPLPDEEAKLREYGVVSVQGNDTSRHPVETVNWEDAMEFCRRLSAAAAERAAGRVYRLPTEAEWEYACRAGTTTRWYCGDEEAGLGYVAWFKGNSAGPGHGTMTHPVGQKKPNAWGLYEMHGNVWQWCADWFDADYYKQSPLPDPIGPPGGVFRVLRGSSWHCEPVFCRSAFRQPRPPLHRSHSRGFRVVCEIAATPAGVAAAAPAKPGATAPQPTVTPVPNPQSPIPAPAVAPFDAAKAREHQETWAKHLGVPVEQTNSIGMKLVLIPPGEFDMGSTPEEIAWALEEGKKAKLPEWYFNGVQYEAPRHRVRITKPFYLGMYPVTQGEYAKVMGVNPSCFTAQQMDASAFRPPIYHFSPEESRKKELESRQRAATLMAGRDTTRYPVETVSWDDCVEFCRKLTALPGERAAGRDYRLPTEAEWEYACRAGTTTRWFFGDDVARLFEYAWYDANGSSLTHPVGQKDPNPWRLYDMLGNAAQWCNDLSTGDYYKQSPREDPQGLDAALVVAVWGDRPNHMYRGGSTCQSAYECRPAYRNSLPHGARTSCHGFRVAIGIAAKVPLDAQSTTPAPPASPAQTASPSTTPAPAVAPFDAAKAREHQETWAKHLGVPVEQANSIGMKLVLIPPGQFEMGSTAEEIAWALQEGKKTKQPEFVFNNIQREAPRHQVRITRPFYLGMFPVTQAEYAKVMGLNPSSFTAHQMDPSVLESPGYDLGPSPKGADRNLVLTQRQLFAKLLAGRDTSRHPVETVSWDDCAEFCRKLSALAGERAAGRVYRLPTEAEWEYACRAGTTSRWFSGDDPARLFTCAWYSENSGTMTHPVGQRGPNAWRLYDMHGNVSQWCSDLALPGWSSESAGYYYRQSPRDDPQGPDIAEIAPGIPARMVRGGCFAQDAFACRSASRLTTVQTYHCVDRGFRVAVGIAAKERVSALPASTAPAASPSRSP